MGNHTTVRSRSRRASPPSTTALAYRTQSSTAAVDTALHRAFPSVTFGFHGSDLRLANEAATAFAARAHEYPEVLTRLQYVGVDRGPVFEQFRATYDATSREPLLPLGDRFALSGGVSGKYLILNANLMADPTRWQHAMDEWTRYIPDNTFPGGNTLTATVNHEFGHLVDAYLTHKAITSLSAQEARRTFFGHIASEHINRGLSRYAQESSQESFAEAFAAHYAPSPAAHDHPYAVALRDWLQSEFKQMRAPK